MPKSITLAALASMALAAPLTAQDAQTILRTMREKQLERWQGVENYTIRQVAAGVPDLQAGGVKGTPVYYEKTSIAGEPGFRMVPQREYMREAMRAAGCAEMTPDQMRQFATGYDMLGSALSRGGGDMPASGGIPGLDLGEQAHQMAEMLRGVAEAEDSDTSPDATVAAGPLAEFARRARLAGREAVLATGYLPGRPGQKRDAYRIVAEDLSDVPLQQAEGGGRFTLDSISLWIDAEEYVPLRMVMGGRLESDGKVAPMTIEKWDLSYASAGPLYEARQHVYHISGLMAGLSDKDRREMEKARRQVAEMKEKLAAMPDGPQKKMMLKMMGPQMSRLEQMTEGGDLTSTIDVVDIEVNAGPPLPVGPDGRPVDCRN